MSTDVPPSADTKSGDVDDVAILGLGESGFAAARLALHQGETVHVSDTRSEPPAPARAADLRALGAEVDLGRHDVARISRARTVVVSPGIPPDAPVLRALRDAGRRWISEPEFAFRFLESALIAVTGTNGKTTTSVLTAHLLEVGGVRAALGGNVGGDLAPAASELALLDPPPEWVVLEVSSFQLADIEHFRPDVGVVTNLAPDHLDRYPDTESYYADKARLFETADAASRWVLNGDDPEVLAIAGDAPGRRYLFTLGEVPASEDGGVRRDVDRAREGATTRPVGGAGDVGDADGWGFVREGVLTLAVDGTGGMAESLLGWDELPLLGRHDRANALAAALAARLAGVGAGAIRQGLRTASPLPHRLEPVGEWGGVLWIDDSKATNVAAAVAAVRSVEGRPLVVLLGGKDKGEPMRPLAEALEGRVRVVLAYGAAGGRIAAELRGHALPVERVGSDFEAVVRRAARVAERGDAVLLAPACSSFDMFDDFRERGERFHELATRFAAGDGAGGSR